MEAPVYVLREALDEQLQGEYYITKSEKYEILEDFDEWCETANVGDSYYYGGDEYTVSEDDDEDEEE